VGRPYRPTLYNPPRTTTALRSALCTSRRRIKEAQMARRQRDEPTGNEAARSYKDELSRRKQEMIRGAAQQQSQAWQQQQDQQGQQ
jgi:hypothetical protein